MALGRKFEMISVSVTVTGTTIDTQTVQIHGLIVTVIIPGSLTIDVNLLDSDSIDLLDGQGNVAETATVLTANDLGVLYSGPVTVSGTADDS